jgi:hypothetical protein
VEQMGKENRVISFGLWGNDRRYTVGLKRNLELIREYYPGWTMRVYHDNEHLEGAPGLEMIYVGKADGCIGLYWRFRVAYDDTVDRWIVMDLDSRPNARCARATKEWIGSGKPFHVIRDHKRHRKPIMGCYFGGVKGVVPNWEELMSEWMKTCDPGKRKRGRYFKTDQFFLKKKIWPLVKDRCIAHDNWKRITGTELPLTVDTGGRFIGEQFDENDRPILR